MVRRRLLIAVVLIVSVLGAARPFHSAAAKAASVAVEARPVALAPEDMGRTVVGRLRYRGGLALASADDRFGGLSALIVAADGRRFVAASDAGYWVRGRLDYNADGDLSGLSAVDITRLIDPGGRPIGSKALGDAEALARGPDGGLIVAFEQAHRLWRYPDETAAPVRLPSPPGLARAPANRGLEALTVLTDGRLLAISEDFPKGSGVAAWVRDRRGRWSPLTYVISEGFRPTGAATVPGGGVLVLERRIPLMAVRIRYLAEDAIVPGAELTATEIARFEGPLTFDNMEGIAARQSAAGTTLIYLISDDNFNFFERTLLMMFELIK